jgi:hypothetical protein
VDVADMGCRGGGVAATIENDEVGSGQKRRWVLAAGVVALIGVGVLSYGMFVGSSVTRRITSPPSASDALPRGQLVWAYECPGGKGRALAGVVDATGTYLSSSDPNLAIGRLPAGDHVVITRYWFRPDRYVYVAQDGERIALHRLTRFLAVAGCPIS